MHARSPRTFVGFLGFVAVAALGVSLPSAFVACSSDETTANANDAGADQNASDVTAGHEASTDDARSDGADSGACKLVKPYSSKDKTCNTCAETECCAEVNGCLGDTACDDDYVNCILACALFPDDAGAGVDAGPDAGIPACEGRCGAQFPKGEAEYKAATGCVDTRCKSDCK
jgi:hypothetical protein